MRNKRRRTDPYFSIVIPARNSEKFIEFSIESILSQTRSNFELIILEHNSIDKTEEIIRSYHDPRIRIISTDETLSMEENWARILTLELGEFLTIVGHDDILYPAFLAEVSKMIYEYPSASLYHTHFNLIDENGEQLRACKLIPFLETADQFLNARHNRMRDSFGTGYVMRSQDYKKVGGLPTELPNLIGADDIAWYRLSKMSYKACNPKFLFGYRYHRKSTSLSIDLLTLFTAHQMYYSLLEDTDYFKNATNEKAATRFFRRSFIGRSRRVLIDLIQESDASRWDGYWEMKKNLIARVGEKPLFKVSDPTVRALEIIRVLPVVLRKPLIRSIEIVGNAVRDI